MKTILFPLSVVVALGAFANPAVPQVSEVHLSQDPSSRRVTVTYHLDEPAIVTLDVMTNGVSIGDANITYVVGDCNKEIGAGDRVLYWLPHKAWPDHVINEPIVSVRVSAWATNMPPDYMVIDLAAADAKTIRYYTSAEALPDGGLSNDVYRKSKLVMRRIHAAGKEFLKGGPKTAFGWIRPWGAGRMVSFTHDYYIGIYPVTQAQHKLVTGNAPSKFGPASKTDWEMRPVETIWFSEIWGGSGVVGTETPDADSAIDKFRKNIQNRYAISVTKDAQWEFACRAGTLTHLYDGKTISAGTEANASLANMGWFTVNSGEETHPVGHFDPNPWGHYDMYGNVAEQCLDWLTDDWLDGTTALVDAFSKDKATCTDSGSGSSSTLWHCVRGGSFHDTWKEANSSANQYYCTHWAAGTASSYYGYRLAITLE